MGKSSARKKQKREAAPEAAKTVSSVEPAIKQRFPKRYLHLLLIAAVGIFVYSNTFHVPFVFDGTGQIRDNRMIKDLGNFSRALEGHHFSAAQGYLYVRSRLVGYLSFALNYSFGRLNVTGYHLTNLAIHIISAILVYFLVLLTFGTPRMRLLTMPHGPPSDRSDTAGLTALFTALLFVSHPIQTEAVTYIVQRFTSLATMFYLLSLVAYIKGRSLVMGNRSGGKEAGQESSPMTHYLLPITFFILSLLSAVLAMKTKEISFTLPIVIVMYEFLFFSAPLKKRLAVLTPALLTLLIIPLTLVGTNKPLSQILSDVIGKTRVDTTIPRSDYLLTQLRVVTTYIRLLFFPAGQNVDYDYPVYHSFFTPPVLLSFLFLAALLATAGYLLHKVRGNRSGVIGEKGPVRGNGSEVMGKKDEQPMTHHPSPITPSFTSSPMTHDPSPITRSSASSPMAHDPSPMTPLYLLISFGILWFFVTLSVTSSVIPIADIIFEHRVYLASVGAFLAVVAAVFALAERLGLSGRKRDRAVIALFCIIVTVLSVTAYSRNAVWKTRMSLWQDAVEKSPDKARPLNLLGLQYFRAGRFDDAVALFKRALEADPAYAETYYDNVGRLYLKRDMLDAARDAFDKELEKNPKSGAALNGLCVIGIKKGQYDAALRACTTATSIDPGTAYEAYNNLSALYRKLGRKEDAARAAEQAIDLNPDFAPSYNNLGLLYAGENRTVEAEANFRKAVRLDPGYTEAYSNLGALYIVTRKPGQAVNALEKALKTSITPYPDLHFNLAVARYLAGDRRGAMQEYEVLRGLAPQEAAKLLTVINPAKK